MTVCMLDIRVSQYSWVISVTTTSFIACLRYSALDICLYNSLSFIIVDWFSIGMIFGLFPGHSSREILFFFFRKSVATFDLTRSAIFHEDRAAVDVHLQFQLLFEQFYILRSIHSGVRRNEIQTSSATARHGTPNHLARQVYHCGYNIYLVKTLTQWPPNVHMAKYKLLHGAFVFHSARVQWR